ncbi:MAG: hypothetical protein WAW85_13995 [Gordonia sp. (in: high G+C Gram-positive bacteria)]|uniref:hypothetical protein n=1 Tax=Gordonia sp. (in: high G+C Gram-positive bacteria) TaxID=84139 RepID=UPI003BB49B3B
MYWSAAASTSTSWWQLNIVDGGKGPLLLAFCAFVTTFLITRTITRLIRSGRGPFHNVSAGGVHMHHSTPGMILLIIGAFTALGAPAHTPWPYVAAVLIGSGSSLVLDEFAMIFRLQDVYWTQEGQLSVNMVTLAGACIGLAVVGFSPANVPELSSTTESRRTVVVIALVVHFGIVTVVALKAKYACMLLGLFLGPVAWVSAVRLARPHSPWARWFYRDRRRAHAQRREDAFNDRWGRVRGAWDDVIGGTPTAADPAPAAPTAG